MLFYESTTFWICIRQKQYTFTLKPCVTGIQLFRNSLYWWLNIPRHVLFTLGWLLTLNLYLYHAIWASAWDPLIVNLDISRLPVSSLPHFLLSRIHHCRHHTMSRPTNHWSCLCWSCHRHRTGWMNHTHPNSNNEAFISGCITNPGSAVNMRTWRENDETVSITLGSTICSTTRQTRVPHSRTPRHKQATSSGAEQVYSNKLNFLHINKHSTRNKIALKISKF